MLQALVKSKLSKTVIGIQSKALGRGVCMTSVVEILVNDADEPTVVLKSYDVTLDEIEGVIPFTSLFENPFLRDINREQETKNFMMQTNE